jgi:hypothetical protein
VRLSHQLIAPLSGAAGIAQATETAERSGVRVFCRRGIRPVVSFFPAPPEPWYYQTAVIAKVAEIYLYFSAHFALSAVTKKEAICGTIIIL